MAATTTQIHATLKRIEALLSQLRIGAGLGGIGRHSDNSAAIVEAINTQLDNANAELDTIDVRLDNVDTKLSTTNLRLANIDSSTNNIETDVGAGGALETKLEAIRALADTSSGFRLAEWLEQIESRLYDGADSALTELQKIDTNTDGIEAKLDTIISHTDDINSPLNAGYLAIIASNAAIEAEVDTLEDLLAETGAKNITEWLQDIEGHVDGVETKLDTLETTLTNIETDWTNYIAAVHESDYQAVFEFDVTSIASGTNVIIKLKMDGTQNLRNVVLSYICDGANTLTVEEVHTGSGNTVKMFENASAVGANTWYHEPENSTTGGGALAHGIRWDVSPNHEIRITVAGVAVPDNIQLAVSAEARTGHIPTLDTSASNATITTTTHAHTVTG